MNSEVIGKLRQRFRGEIISPSDPGYDAARKVYNAMIEKRPALIARCTDVSDVMAAVEFSRENDLLTAIRGGGHNVGGLGSCDGGLVVDLSRMKGIRVDPKARTVRVEGGCVWGDVDHATHAFGMAVPSGTVSTTGVAGLTLGGGLGHLSRPYGLTVDNLLEADVVLADGTFVRASADENPDLFWALRGGGGNFGIVTSFLFRMHPAKIVISGVTFWPLDQTPQVIKTYREFIAQAPENISGFLAFLTVPPAAIFPSEVHGKKVCGIVWCSLASEEEMNKATKPMRSVGKPMLDHTGPMPFPALQSLFDPLLVPGLQHYWRGDFLKDISDDAIPKHVEHASKMPTPLSTVHFYPINGAVHRVGKNDTAFSHRDVLLAEVIVGLDPDPANKEKITQWCKTYFDDLHRYATGNTYVNFMMEEGEVRAKAAFGDNYARLAQIKRKYDPTNFFRVNQNIPPAA
jgi:FAD/FMN-containing dehydrogenase